MGERFWPAYPGRDPERTPMPWAEGPGGGFTAPGAHPWLPMDYPAAMSVAAQRGDPASTLTLVRDLIALRRGSADLSLGRYVEEPAPTGAWRWRRGEDATVVCNFAEEPTTFGDLAGTVAVATDRGRDGEVAGGTLTLGPRQGAVVIGGPPR